MAQAGGKKRIRVVNWAAATDAGSTQGLEQYMGGAAKVTVGAAPTLEQYACTAVDGADRRLSRIITTHNWADNVNVQMFEKPKAWRLVCSEGDGGIEEMVFSIRGSILEKDLPPITEKPRMGNGKLRFLRQSIKIAGLGTPTFDAALRSTAEIFGLFDREFREGALESWSGTNVEGIGGDTFEASNRYVTARRDASDEDTVGFGELVDPKDILRKMAGDQYVHTMENQVLYFKRRADDAGKATYDTVGPQIFRIGDIVEVQVSFVVVPLRGDRFKMISVLRSIALLDVAFSKMGKKATTEVVTQTVVKRKVTYDDEGRARRSKGGGGDVEMQQSQ